MADIISFADWQEMQALIQEGNAAVSGMTAAEAQAALGASERSGLYTYSAITAAGANNVINFPNAATAAEAAAEYVSAGGATSSAGAATAATGAAKNAANLTVIEGGAAGTSGVAGLLAMPLPTAAAAIAPLAGAALGAGLYNLNPELWTKISQTLLPFCYENSELLPVTVDQLGNTYYSQETIEALKKLFKDEGLLDPTFSPADEYSDNGNVVISNIGPASSLLKYVLDRSKSIAGGSWIFSDAVLSAMTEFIASHEGEYCDIRWIEGSFSGASPLTISFVPNINVGDNIRTGSSRNAYQFNTSGVREAYGLPININSYSTTSSSIVIISGEEDSYYTTSSGEIRLTDGKVSNINATSSLPTGIDNWQGNQYPDGVTPIKVLKGYDAEGNPIYTPYYPVTTPIGDPGVSTDPSVNPDPAVNPNPAPAIEPYITPSPDPAQYPQSVPPSNPAPLPNPIPAPQPVPDPSADPSQETENLPDDPTSPKPPTDGGESGTTIIPSIPTLPSAATGLLHVYNPTQEQIDGFGTWLWTTFSGDLIDTLSKLFNDPMEAVIGLHELYATPSTQGDATIRAGYLDSGISAKLVGNRYTTINCGSIVVEEYYQNYLDYSPYTQVYIYLPFIGIVPVSADDIIGNAVNITYHVDSYTGSCIAVISVAREGYSSTVYQFQGNCAVEIPISSGFQSTLMGGLLGLAGTAISGNPAVGLTAAHIGRAGLGKNAVSHSGSFGSSYGAMGCKIPYVIVRRPVQKKVIDYSKSYGYPAHKMVYIGNCKGYLRAKEVRVTSTKATNVEKEMIVSALKSGVYVN